MAEKKERIPCIKPTCNGTLNPLLADHLKGYCMPCFDAIEKAAKDEYIEQNLKLVDPYEGLVDPVEILYTMYKSDNDRDPLIELVKFPKTKFELIKSMTTSELKKLEESLISGLQSVNKRERAEAREIFEIAANLTDMEVEQILLLIIELETGLKNQQKNAVGDAAKHEFHLHDSETAGSSDSIFRMAGESVKQELLMRLAAGDLDMLDKLARIDDLSKKLITINQNPPGLAVAFQSKLKYTALEAGWEITDSNEKRYLYYQNCYGLELAETSTQSSAQLTLYTDANERCPFCQGPLMHQAVISPGQFEKLTTYSIQHQLAFYFCDSCSNRIDEMITVIEEDRSFFWPDNQFKWGAAEERANIDFDQLAEKNLNFKIAEQIDPFFYSGQMNFSSEHNSKFGGAPDWLQSPEYPGCPACQRSMKFIFQIDAEGLNMFQFGIHYAFVCDLCWKYTATLRQFT